MKSAAPPPRPSSDETDESFALPLTPLLDIVFILLIFMMIAVNLNEQSLPIELPDISSRQSQQSADFIIEVNAQGDIYYDGVPVRPEDLAERMGPPGNDSLLSGRRILLRVDEAASFGVAAHIMSLLQERGVVDLSIATESP
ncbi:MAG: biopolymer transporter ExbD [Leptospiraceae bacterium]|nr:biopolymer transporter ExbD [Leptospiraceae bacterium]